MATDQYRDQVRLLLDVLPLVMAEPAFALKGGTAINLFEWDLPRLSVDIVRQELGLHMTDLPPPMFLKPCRQNHVQRREEVGPALSEAHIVAISRHLDRRERAHVDRQLQLGLNAVKRSLPGHCFHRALECATTQRDEPLRGSIVLQVLCCQTERLEMRAGRHRVWLPRIEQRPQFISSTYLHGISIA